MTGEPAATRELFRRHQRRVHASLYRVLGSNHDRALQPTWLAYLAAAQQ